VADLRDRSLAAVVIGLLGLDVDFTRAAALITAAPVA